MELKGNLLPGAMELKGNLLPRAMELKGNLLPRAMELKGNLLPRAMELKVDLLPRATGWSRHLCLRLGLDKQHGASAPESPIPRCHPRGQPND
jgi:hypothetical protein